ncbi:MAG: aminotransferase class V-fold PLP-dependent enzyme [Myxococcales bacterium]|nr:aminotransferase class V-fold PLP-dependent enzyme [Myxococcales bacterium]
MSERDAERLAKLWSLDEHVAFLNHGSFGACPTPVLESQQALRERMERQPVQMLHRDLGALLDVAREELARFVGADAEGLAFVPNATTGVNTVLRSLRFGPDDELLVTNQAYGACRNAVHFVADRAGARVAQVEVPFPCEGPQQVIDAIVGAVTERTRLALIDHVASPTGLVFPIAEITAALRERGVQVLVDGAHAPGMVELNVDAIGADYYVGNCHKWLCAPKSAGFLSVQPQHRSAIRPLTISHGASAPEDRRFRAEFDWVGTIDPSAVLCVPEAIHTLAAFVPGGWPEVRARNHGLAVRARQLLCAALGAEPPCPEDMIGSMAAVPLPPPHGNPFKLHRILLEQHRIEVQVYPVGPGRRLLRVSCQLYNELEQYQHLAKLLPEALEAEAALED